MEGSSSSNFEYPYPSHVCAPNFVTTKLNGRDVYDIWKTQMLCLLESHDMLGFIAPAENCVFGMEKDRLWRRSDALVKGWILGSLTEQPLKYVVQTNACFTSKDTNDLDLDEGRLKKQEESIIEEESTIEENLISEEQKEIEKKEREEADKVHQSLYKATQSKNYSDVYSILNAGKVRVTDKITINGNTVLHLAVGTTKKIDILEKMLEMAPEGDTLLDMKNSEGSTLLHVAAIVGNTHAARILVGKNQDLLRTKDKEGHTPLARALSNMHTDTYLYLLNPTPDIEMATLFVGISGDELLVNAISAKDYHSASVLIRKHYNNIHSDAALMAIAQNFPRKLNNWETTVYEWVTYPEKWGAMILSLFVLSMFWVAHPHKMRVLFIYKRKKPTVISILISIYCLLLVIAGLYQIFKYILITLLKMKQNLPSCRTISGIYKPLQHIIRLLPNEFKFVTKRFNTRSDAMNLLTTMCELIKTSIDSRSHRDYYNNAILEASRQNAYEVVTRIVSYFPNAILSSNEDGHNIIQYAVINRSEKVYNLLYQMSEHKNIYRTIKDPLGNNLLHLAARLAPTNKLNYISGAALQIQHELQWFKEVKGFVCPLNIIQRYSSGETPEMVFTREHKDLVIEGEKWMKETAQSYTITAALITTIVFAAAITVPGGNKDNGIPMFTNQTAFTIFAVSDAISLFTSVTSLLMFLSILTTRFAEQDFLFKLPTKLIIGLTTLLISTTAMLIAFGATVYLVFGQNRHHHFVFGFAIYTD